jgi:hypothetical protein
MVKSAFHPGFVGALKTASLSHTFQFERERLFAGGTPFADNSPAIPFFSLEAATIDSV